MSFMKNLEDETNVSTTENGALGFRTTKSHLLDLNFAVASLRSESETKIISMFRQAWAENQELAIKWLFYARDARKGLGERRLFRIAIVEIIKEVPSKILNWIVEFGRYDDLFVLFNTPAEAAMLDFVQKQLKEDAANVDANKPISLLAKWMPSNNTSSKATTALAKKFQTHFGEKPRDYRKFLARLRRHIDIVETKMTKKQWDQIDYATVPSRANLIYNGAFIRNDETRRREFLGKVERGEATIHAGTLFPHDILHKYCTGSVHAHRVSAVDAGIEALWKALPNYMEGTNQSTIVVCDVSGSMTWCTVGNTKILPLTVASALSIYFAERCHGEFKDKFITFSDRPQFIDLQGLTTLHSKFDKVTRSDVGGSTNIEKVFELLLNTAKRGNSPQDQIPNILIISDMEFNQGTYSSRGNSDKLMDGIAARWNEAGYELPRMAYWNVASRTATIPQISNKNGLALVSGFSPTVVQQVLSPHKSPYDALVEVLLSERYKDVTLK